MPTVHDIRDALLACARRQAATTKHAKEIAELIGVGDFAEEHVADFRLELDHLLVAIANNAAMVVREMIDSAIEAAQPEDDDARPTALDRFESCGELRREQCDDEYIETLRAERS